MDEFYTVKNLIEILPIGRNQVYKLINTKGFPSINIGRKIVIPKKQFEEWINENIGSTIYL